MGRGVLKILYDPRFGDERVTGDFAECGLIDAGCESLLEGFPQCSVMRVEPVDRDLERKPRVEAGTTGVRQCQALRSRGVAENLREFGGEKGELRHC
jgi:hypothetical protein